MGGWKQGCDLGPWTGYQSVRHLASNNGGHSTQLGTNRFYSRRDAADRKGIWNRRRTPRVKVLAKDSRVGDQPADNDPQCSGDFPAGCRSPGMDSTGPADSEQ